MRAVNAAEDEMAIRSLAAAYTDAVNRRDGEAMTATDGWLNQNSMQFAFNIATSGAIV